MQRGGGGAVFGEINVNSRRPLIPDVRAANRRLSAKAHLFAVASVISVATDFSVV